MSESFFAVELPDDWEQTTLGVVVERGKGSIQTGPFGSQLHASDYVPIGVPSIMPINIGDNRIIEEGIARITEADAKRLSRHRVQVGDIIYSRRGDVERRALIRKEQAGWLCGTGCLKVRLGTGVVDPLFTSHYLGHPDVRAWIVQHAVGATMPNLNTGIMEAVPFLLPPLREQQAIACILGAFDDKIELNRRRNRTLEAMARALFQSWFVDFDPVRAKAAGRQPAGLLKEIAAPFPREFADSELGEIPKGWRAGVVGDVAEFNGWTLGKRDELEEIDYIEISEVMRGEIANITRYARGEEPGRARRRLRHGDTAISTVRPDRGSYFLCLDPTSSLIASTGFAVLTAKNDYWAFVHVLTTGDEFSKELGRLADGGAYPAIRPEVIAARPVVIPSNDEVLVAFDKLAQPLFLKAEVAKKESRTLAFLRDTLLPKLISGELRVPDAERIVGRNL